LGGEILPHKKQHKTNKIIHLLLTPFNAINLGDLAKVGVSEFESRFPLQIQKALIERLGLFYC